MQIGLIQRIAIYGYNAYWNYCDIEELPRLRMIIEYL